MLPPHNSRLNECYPGRLSIVRADRWSPFLPPLSTSFPELLLLPAGELLVSLFHRLAAQCLRLVADTVSDIYIFTDRSGPSENHSGRGKKGVRGSTIEKGECFRWRVTSRGNGHDELSEGHERTSLRQRPTESEPWFNEVHNFEAKTIRGVKCDIKRWYESDNACETDQGADVIY